MPFDLGAGVVVGLGIVLVLGAFLFFGIGFIWWQRVH
jgi:hypothetical protein